MTMLQSRINTRDDAFAINRDHMQTQVDDLRGVVDKIRAGGGAKAQERHTSRGKLLPRDRLNALLDPGSPFLELSQLAAYKVYENRNEPPPWFRIAKIHLAKSLVQIPV